MRNLVFPICYLIGAIPFSYLIAKFVSGEDIRRIGSGNVGASNVMRTTGRLPGLLALVLDFIKGAVCVGIARYVFLGNETYMALAGFLAPPTVPPRVTPGPTPTPTPTPLYQPYGGAYPSR